MSLSGLSKGEANMEKASFMTSSKVENKEKRSRKQKKDVYFNLSLIKSSTKIMKTDCFLSFKFLKGRKPIKRTFAIF